MNCPSVFGNWRWGTNADPNTCECMMPQRDTPWNCVDPHVGCNNANWGLSSECSGMIGDQQHSIQINQHCPNDNGEERSILHIGQNFQTSLGEGNLRVVVSSRLGSERLVPDLAHFCREVDYSEVIKTSRYCFLKNFSM